ncbi:hypothetical protein TRFO_42012 [Tritrichomonas foetus]|uniref:Tc1-like transposase DDE domain-containing protein n=1 Tax=Tritrichomonas foetus TaxID=1144522 RepID=A0A1J4KZ71_9EUKA|nr:hypothetical protein TRFO_42012 [Tritrichomonas foetus]|eukprot:OHT16160.1 hypothetical protein TRFO_42012 [Tritrichomonas foetus]
MEQLANCSDFKSELIQCSNGVDSEEYVQIIEKSKFISICNNKYGKYKYYFMQDVAPCHTSSSTMQYFIRKTKIIPDWPPKSPDLNPIEMIWSIIKRKIKSTEIKNKISLINCIQLAWNEISMNLINDLVGDFNRRIELTLAVNGASISLMLSSHTKKPKRIPELTVAPITEDEDAIIISHVDKIWRKWKTIATLLGRNSANLIKNRYFFLVEQKRNIHYD